MQFQWRKNRAGIAFIDENGGGPGVRLRKRHQIGREPKKKRREAI
jgi:hypothetical protein